MQKLFRIFAVTIGLVVPAMAGLGSKDALYVGGTAEIKEQTEGKSSTADKAAFVFECK